MRTATLPQPTTARALDEIIVDSFAGGGGASAGIELALGRSPDVAINHNLAAILMHEANHPSAEHHHSDVWEVDPDEATHGAPVGLMWASPDCRHFSKAKGAKPVSKKIRGLAWVVVKWAARVAPRVIILENVGEFVTWGPLDRAGMPIKAKAGRYFREFVAQLRALGYLVEWRELNAADYGAPTRRIRFFLIARRDGESIRWPEPTHGPGRAEPYRTAAQCIDWSIRCPSIFRRKRPLAAATQARVALGVRRFVLDVAQPFLAPVTVTGERGDQVQVAAFLAKHYGGVVGHGLGRPLGTITQVDHHSLVTCELAPVAQAGARGERVYAFLTKFYGTGAVGQPVDEPLHTITSRHRFGLVTVTVAGEELAIVDIGLRMLAPRELARAQGFPAHYILTGTARDQVARIGNSVPPPVAAALVAANLIPAHRAAA
jgi:DNA (cytosine-5)-methyltransferase 1